MILCIHNVDILNICMKEFGSQKIIIDKMTAMRTLTFLYPPQTVFVGGYTVFTIETIFQDCIQTGYACSVKVHTWADQLLSQLLIEHFDTLPTQCRHIEHMHEGVWFSKMYY